MRIYPTHRDSGREHRFQGVFTGIYFSNFFHYVEELNWEMFGSIYKKPPGPIKPILIELF